MSPSMEYAYTLAPPSDVQVANTPAAATRTFPISAPPPSTAPAFYTSAGAAVIEMQARLNQDLTAWKDAIGDREKHKEDLGKIAPGKGKASRMMEANAANEVDEADEDEEDE